MLENDNVLASMLKARKRKRGEPRNMLIVDATRRLSKYRGPLTRKFKYNPVTGKVEEEETRAYLEMVKKTTAP
jgi:hypothetical protein